jgi:DNA-binding IscR family transcriptional regulator
VRRGVPLVSPLVVWGGEQCLTHDLWEELSDQIHLFLNSVTLYDVIEGRVRRDLKVIGGMAELLSVIVDH